MTFFDEYRLFYVIRNLRCLLYIIIEVVFRVHENLCMYVFQTCILQLLGIVYIKGRIETWEELRAKNVMTTTVLWEFL